MRVLLLAIVIGLTVLPGTARADEPVTIVHGSEDDAPPWRLKLADGTMCEAIWGGTAAAGAATATYGCRDGWSLDDRLYQGRTWVAIRLKVELKERGFELTDMEPVAVSEVWYCHVSNLAEAQNPSCP